MRADEAVPVQAHNNARAAEELAIPQQNAQQSAVPQSVDHLLSTVRAGLQAFDSNAPPKGVASMHWPEQNVPTNGNSSSNSINHTSLANEENVSGNANSAVHHHSLNDAVTDRRFHAGRLHSGVSEVRCCAVPSGGLIIALS